MVDTLVGVGAAAVIGWIGGGLVWTSRTNARLSIVETKLESYDAWLKRVEAKLDRVIEHRR